MHFVYKLLLFYALNFAYERLIILIIKTKITFFLLFLLCMYAQDFII